MKRLSIRLLTTTMFSVAFFFLSNIAKAEEVYRDNHVRFTLIDEGTIRLEYAPDAFELRASGYVSKPATEQKIRAEIDNLRYPMPKPQSGKRISARCFGSFDVMADGKPLTFKREKTKELFAYLIDRRGAACTPREICSALWEEEKPDYLRQLIGRDIRELFRESEAAFRDAETEAIRQLAARDGYIIACGGGVVKRAENMELLRSTGRVIFLDRDVRCIARSVDTQGRPLLSSSADRLQQLYDERIGLYRKYSHYTVKMPEGPEEAAASVLSLVRQKHL